MAKQGRYFRPMDSSLKGTGYDSKLEQRLHQGPLAPAHFHTLQVEYTWEHKYEPDFVVDRGDRLTMVECKGYFMDRNDCTKYLWVRRSLGANQEIVFCFESPNKPIHFQSKRQDGSKMTHAEWAEKHGFRWFSEDNISEVFN